MTRFRFRLAPLQRLRHQREESCQLALARELVALERLRTEEGGKAASLSALDGQLARTTSVSIEQLALGRASYENSARTLRGLRASREEQQVAVSSARATLAEASRAREALDRLRDEARGRHERTHAAAELDELDESALRRSR